MKKRFNEKNRDENSLSKQLWSWTFILLVYLLSSVNAIGQITPSTYCDGKPADWASFTTNPTYAAATHVEDIANASGNIDDQFTKGSQDVKDLNRWFWSFGGANDKGDITNAGAALDGCVLRFFGDRTAINGDAAIGFWFFKEPLVFNADGSFSGLHSDGDLLILSHFTDGGGTSTIEVYQWLDGELVEYDLAGVDWCASVNSDPETVPSPLEYTPKFGTSGTYPTGAFFEGAINLCDLGASSCFSYFLLETRNSQSITASLQDLAAGEFDATPDAPLTVSDSRCGPGVVELSASGCDGGTLTWYDAATDGNIVTTGSSYSPELTETTSYWVSCSINDCEGPRTQVTGTIVQRPPAPGVSIIDVSICGPSTATVTVTCPLNPEEGDPIYEYKNGGDPSDEDFLTTGWTTDPEFDGLAAGDGFSIRVRLIAFPDCYSDATTCLNYEENTEDCVQPILGSSSAVQNSSVATLSAASDIQTKESLRSEDITAYPVPFSRNATVEFRMANSERYEINLYDMKGNLIKQLKSGKAKAGELQQIEVDGQKLPEGMYLVRVVTRDGAQTVKLLKKE